MFTPENMTKPLKSMTDAEIITKWRVADLDALHAFVGLELSWKVSDRRRRLAQIEHDEMERLKRFAASMNYKLKKKGTI